MLPRKRKVGIELFPFVLKKGKTVSSEHFSFKFAPILGIQESKFSFVVSGKVSKKATERNLLKRRGYVMVKKIPTLKKIPIAGVFFAKQGATKLPYGVFKKEVDELLTKAHIT